MQLFATHLLNIGISRSRMATFSIKRKDLCPEIDWDCVLFILLPGSSAQSGSQSHPKQISGAANIDSVVPAFLLSAFLRRHTFSATMALFREERIYVQVIKYFKNLIYVHTDI